jgi:hypothetical protein
MKTQTGDRVQFRLVQGAQEVQHTFNLEGYNWVRNIDQRFSMAMLPLDDTTPRQTLSQKCDDVMFGAGVGAFKLTQAGRADEYYRWLREGPDSLPASMDFWRAYEKTLESCFNREGRITAQEVGISEHFEFNGTYRNDYNLERNNQAGNAAMPPILRPILCSISAPRTRCGTAPGACSAPSRKAARKLPRSRRHRTRPSG